MLILQKPDSFITALSTHGPRPPPDASGEAGRVRMKKTARKAKEALIKDMILRMSERSGLCARASRRALLTIVSACSQTSPAALAQLRWICRRLRSESSSAPQDSCLTKPGTRKSKTASKTPSAVKPLTRQTHEQRHGHALSDPAQNTLMISHKFQHERDQPTWKSNNSHSVSQKLAMNMPSHATKADIYRIRLYPNRSPIRPKKNAAALRHCHQLRT